VLKVPLKRDSTAWLRRVEGSVEKGFHRVAWDLRYPALTAIDEKNDEDDREPKGVMAAPGVYTVTLSKLVDGQITDLSEFVPFKVERLREGALEGSSPQETAAFWQEIAKLERGTSAASLVLKKALGRVDGLKTSLSRVPAAPGALDQQLHDLRKTLFELDEQLNGNRSKGQVGEKNNPTINYRLRVARSGTFSSTYGPTPTHQRSLEIASTQFDEFKIALEKILNKQLPKFEKDLQAAGAPWIPGQPIPEN